MSANWITRLATFSFPSGFRLLQSNIHQLRSKKTLPCVPLHHFSPYQNFSSDRQDHQDHQQQQQQQDRTKKSKSYTFRHLLWIFPITSFCLGAWQVKRLRWKHDLIDKRDDQLSFPVVPIEECISDPDRKMEKWELRKVSAEGSFDLKGHLIVGPRMRGNSAGFNVVSPFILETGERVLINRGWYPRTLSNQEIINMVNKDTQSLRQMNNAKSVIVGIIRAPQSQKTFTPHNDPVKNMWYWLDVDSMAKITDSLPILMDLSEDHNQVPPSGYPIPGATFVKLPNNHLTYAVTWFSLSGFLAFYCFMVSRGRMSPF